MRRWSSEVPGSLPVRPGRRGPAARRAHRSRGQALAELALVTPVVLLLMLVAVDFGRLFFTYIAVNNAAREATYYAAANAADPGFDQAAYEAAAANAALRETNAQAQGGTGAMSVSQPRCFSPGTGTTLPCSAAADFAGGIGNQVTVTATQPFSFITPLIGDLFGGQLTLSASATAPVLNPRAARIIAGSPLPTASPSPSPSPTPSPSPGPTLEPGATPSPTPSPSPVPTPTPVPTCTVPNFVGTYWNNVGGVPALQVWAEAGFTGELRNNAGPNQIQSQTLTAGTQVLCTSEMRVRQN